MEFDISKLDKRITIQKPVKTSDSMGGFTETWYDVIPVWAAIWPKSAKETFKATEQVSGELTHRIRIRWRRGILPSYRIKYKTRYFNIVGPPINPDEDNEWLDIMCKEVK